MQVSQLGSPAMHVSEREHTFTCNIQWSLRCMNMLLLPVLLCKGLRALLVAHVQMLAWAFEPAEPEILHQLIAKGRKDAEAWALQSGAVDGAEGQGRAEQAKQQMQEEEYPALKS